MILILLESHGLVKNCAAINTFNLYSLYDFSQQHAEQNDDDFKDKKNLDKESDTASHTSFYLSLFKAKSNAREAVKPIQYIDIA